MLTSKDIIDLYKKYDVSASKRFGQNFLINQGVLGKIVNAADVKDKEVIEIGPGLGSLTMALLPEVKAITSYEIDEDMVKVLEGEIVDEKFTLVKGDFLKDELSWKGKKTLVANIPYYITSDILFKIFDNHEKFDRCVLMMQDEVASRLSAKIGSKTYGKLTLTTQLFTKDLKKEFVVSPGSFLPAPKVKSAVVSFNMSEGISKDVNELKIFFKTMFSFRRKTLYNNMKRLSIDVEDSMKIILGLGLKESARPQELSLEQFISLFEAVKKVDPNFTVK